MATATFVQADQSRAGRIRTSRVPACRTSLRRMPLGQGKDMSVKSHERQLQGSEANRGKLRLGHRGGHPGRAKD